VTGASPFGVACSGVPAQGTLFVGTEVEPTLAADPADARRLVAAWQQDRWSTGGASGIVAATSADDGATWTASPMPFSRCGGGTATTGGDYERVTDPWLSISSRGVAYLVAYAFDTSRGAHQAIVVARSTGAGQGWSQAVELTSLLGGDSAVDKPTVTADPFDARRAYAVWESLGGLASSGPVQTGPAMLSLTTDEGLTWSSPSVIHDPGENGQTIANQIVVLGTGELIDLFVRLTELASPSPVAQIMLARSADHGASWSPPELVALEANVDPGAAGSGGIRSGAVVPAFASDAAGHTLYVAWTDVVPSGQGGKVGIFLSRSADGGRTWSPPVRVNGEAGVDAFRPALAVSATGAVAVSYYDRRVTSAAPGLWTTAWRAVSVDSGATFTEAAIGGPFDLSRAPTAGGRHFVGDYTGLAAVGEAFVALFPMSLGDSVGSTDLSLAR
jgi:hypothetical protein